ncbi:heavy-metal-associated domain-containing protein [Streptomyces sp. SCSIO 30461]|uniref:heavy-metal-associated domain-containing protein n=1 Tax=Streptomyces sp. SCSIO 30461 TaxID=3118085 RepID=UPI0030CD7C18
MTAETTTETAEATGSCCSPGGSCQGGTADISLGAHSAVYEVRGMTCGHCEGAVSSEIAELPGVISVAAAAGTGEVTVVSEAPLDESMVRAAVDEAGYELVSQA